MKRTGILLFMGLWALIATPAGQAAADRFAAGFFTRGVDVAYYLDQGSPTLDPFYVPVQTGALLPRVSLAVLHEDNVFLEPGDGTAATSISLAPGLLAIWGRAAGNHVYADYGMNIPLYSSEEEISDDPSHLLRLGLVYRTAKSQVNIEGGARHLEDLDYAVGARVVKGDYFGDLNLEHRISAKSSLGAVGRLERHEFEAESYVDYDRQYGAGRVYHRLTPKSEGFLQLGLGRDEPLHARHADSAADFYDLSLGLRGKQSPKLSSSGRVGYMWRQYDSSTRPDLEHWIASLEVKSTPVGLTTFELELYADVRPAADQTGVDTIDQGLVVSAQRRLFIERLRGNASLTLGQITYHGQSLPPPSDGLPPIYDGREDTYWGFTVGADWWTRQRFSLGLAYSYMERNESRDGAPSQQQASSYEYARWVLRASWNY